MWPKRNKGGQCGYYACYCKDMHNFIICEGCRQTAKVFKYHISEDNNVLQQHATAILEFKCKDGKVTVNLSHDL